MRATQSRTPLTAVGSSARPMGVLSNHEIPAGAEAYARRLRQNAQIGEFDAALAELAAAPHLGVNDPPLLFGLRETVARELTRRADHLFGDLTIRAVHVLGISQFTSETMVVDGEGQMHLLTGRVPSEDGSGEAVHTACGQRFWSELERPMRAGMRGSWHSPEFYAVRPCAGCAEHADDFPETKVAPGDPELPPAIAAQLTEAVRESVCQGLSEDMSTIAALGAVPALEAAERRYHAALTDGLAAQAHSGGDAVMKRVLLRYYDNARRDLLASGYTGTISALVSEEDWQEAVSNTLEDILEEDDGAVAQSYLYSELRSIIGERIRRERLLGSP